MTATTKTSELEAINIVLQAAEEAPVQALDLSGLYPLDLAKACLSEASRVIQSLGWSFNTEDGYSLPRNGSNEIQVADNIVKVNVDNTFTSVDPVQRGSRLYDRKAHSYSFAMDLKATVVVLLTWDELPEPARRYITVRAARTMQGRTSVSESVYKYSEEDEQTALVALGSHEAETGDHNMLRDSISVAGVLFDNLF